MIECPNCASQIEDPGAYHAIRGDRLHTEVTCPGCGTRYRYFPDSRRLVEEPPPEELE